jgi:alkylation response protein AidB-like acyl-CoA dehydrogenase
MTTDPDHDTQILDAIDRFLKTEVRPHVKRLEQADEYPAEIVEQMKKMGLFGCIIPAEYGGLGLSTATYAAVVARIASVLMSISGIIN